MMYDSGQSTNTSTASGDGLLTVPIIEKLCEFWSIILAGT